MVYAIIACEIGFWLLIALGLVARYPLRRPRLGLVLLALTPVVDVALLAFTVIDLRAGGQPGWAHGLAALYLGYSVMFGKRAIAWADRTYRRRVRGEQVPDPVAGSKLRREWADFGRAVVAAGIAAVVLEVCVALAGGGPEAMALRDWHPRIGVVLFFWFVTGPAWVMLSPSERRAVEAR
ncbi:hypothetical protein ACFORJ_00490 [Corynebacterium hansenii]|uniref:Integral membrane protein n=1 Tax=Corynebacterium hansenii TaxID=394964 RepID=A0ABV7ZJB2_9CORY|nr:hypothetical protein [Corynebacterium hansenii]WJY99523.1 hypothetical protein CHAN_04500 [Corynebacterium hansenii]